MEKPTLLGVGIQSIAARDLSLVFGQGQTLGSVGCIRVVCVLVLVVNRYCSKRGIAIDPDKLFLRREPNRVSGSLSYRWLRLAIEINVRPAAD